MIAYKTNSADYLDYVASVKSRQEIMADPDLCLLLENPYIKDNMEMAIRWNKAKYGDYQDKYDFMEYFFCNGPELDADSILHYRMKAYNDPVCMEIAYSYLSDMSHLSKVRNEKYNKDSDDCFKNPCFYMGKFSAMMGNCGDVENTNTAFNAVSKWCNSAWAASKRTYNSACSLFNRGEIPTKPKQEDNPPAQPKPQSGDAPTGTGTMVDPGEQPAPQVGNSNPPSPQPCGGMRKAFQGGIIPAMKVGFNMMWAQISQGNESFCKELCEIRNTSFAAGKIGDKLSSPMGEMLDIITKANVKRQMGDCARLWSQVRRLRLFSHENKYGPVVASQLVGNKNIDGTPQDVPQQVTVGQATKPLKPYKKAKQKLKKK